MTASSPATCYEKIDDGQHELLKRLDTLFQYQTPEHAIQVAECLRFLAGWYTAASQNNPDFQAYPQFPTTLRNDP